MPDNFFIVDGSLFAEMIGCLSLDVVEEDCGQSDENDQEKVLQRGNNFLENMF